VIFKITPDTCLSQGAMLQVLDTGWWLTTPLYLLQLA